MLEVLERQLGYSSDCPTAFAGGRRKDTEEEQDRLTEIRDEDFRDYGSVQVKRSIYTHSDRENPDPFFVTSSFFSPSHDQSGSPSWTLKDHQRARGQVWTDSSQLRFLLQRDLLSREWVVQNQAVLSVGGLLCFVLLVGTIGFSCLEKWPLWDAFCFSLEIFTRLGGVRDPHLFLRGRGGVPLWMGYTVGNSVEASRLFCSAFMVLSQGAFALLFGLVAIGATRVRRMRSVLLTQGGRSESLTCWGKFHDDLRVLVEGLAFVSFLMAVSTCWFVWTEQWTVSEGSFFCASLYSATALGDLLPTSPIGRRSLPVVIIFGVLPVQMLVARIAGVAAWWSLERADRASGLLLTRGTTKKGSILHEHSEHEQGHHHLKTNVRETGRKKPIVSFAAAAPPLGSALFSTPCTPTPVRLHTKDTPDVFPVPHRSAEVHFQPSGLIIGGDGAEEGGDRGDAVSVAPSMSVSMTATDLGDPPLICCTCCSQIPSTNLHQPPTNKALSPPPCDSSEVSEETNNPQISHRLSDDSIPSSSLPSETSPEEFNSFLVSFLLKSKRLRHSEVQAALAEFSSRKLCANGEEKGGQEVCKRQTGSTVVTCRTDSHCEDSERGSSGGLLSCQWSNQADERVRGESSMMAGERARENLWHSDPSASQQQQQQLHHGVSSGTLFAALSRLSSSSSSGPPTEMVESD